MSKIAILKFFTKLPFYELVKIVVDYTAYFHYIELFFSWLCYVAQSVTPALGKLRWEDYSECEASLGSIGSSRLPWAM